MSIAYFITGTDTNVGKTLVACALLHKFAQAGQRVAGMKPVAAGVDADGNNEDVVLLRAASNITAAPELTNPYLLRSAISPHLAARQNDVFIDIEYITLCLAQLRAQADCVIVEGAGGFRVPLNDTQDSADLALALALPVIMVVGLRLGCLNHALLTQEAIAARGLRLAGWVANQIDPHMHAVEDNVATLSARIAAPMLGMVPFQTRPDAMRVTALLTLPDPRPR